MRFFLFPAKKNIIQETNIFKGGFSFGRRKSKVVQREEGVWLY
jgi:hypothetical protein